MEFGDCCSGWIGAGQCFCMKPCLVCLVASHERTRFTWEQLVGGLELAGVFICGSLGADEAKSLLSFTSPVLPGSRLPKEAFDKLELSPCSLLSWQATFQGLLNQHTKATMDLQAKTVLFEDTKSEVKFGYTPCKRPADDNDFAKWSDRTKSKLPPVDKDLGDKASPAVSRILTGGLWRTLVSNVEAIQASLLLLGSTSKARFSNLDQAWDNLKYKVSLLKALVGDHPDSMGTSSVFDAIASLSHKLAWVKAQPSYDKDLSRLAFLLSSRGWPL
ncbi:hypothetical protein ACA910_002092 [Epithemia clementina (nom. ined.)]